MINIDIFNEWIYSCYEFVSIFLFLKNLYDWSFQNGIPVRIFYFDNTLSWKYGLLFYNTEDIFINNWKIGNLSH